MSGERILIVEDERAVARGLEYGLNKEGFKTIWASTGQQAIELVEKRDPHLILLDIRLPDLSGFDVCRQLRFQKYRQPILMLTASDEQVDKVLGLELGADDYVVKPYQIRELIARVRSLLRRAYGEFSSTDQGERISFGEVEIDLAQLVVNFKGQPVYLTSTEFRLLHYLAVNPNRPISRDTLIEAVWGYESGISSDRTVDVHIRHLREKLELDPADPQFIITIRGMGYKLVR